MNFLPTALELNILEDNYRGSKCAPTQLGWGVGGRDIIQRFKKIRWHDISLDYTRILTRVQLDHFWSRTEFQFTNGCACVESTRFTIRLGGVHTGGESGSNLGYNSHVNKHRAKSGFS